MHFWGLGEEYWYLLLHFLLFLRVFGLFLRYSCSISFRELKNAIKNSFFLYLGGLGTKIRFSSRKKNGAEYWYRRSGLGKDIGSTCLLYWGVLITYCCCIYSMICSYNFHNRCCCCNHCLATQSLEGFLL